MASRITFIAALSTSPKWLTVDDEGEAKVVLVTSSSELASIMALSVLGKKSLRITIQEED